MMTAETLPVIFITQDLAEETARLLNTFAVRAPSEGVVYWFGLERDDMAVVTTLIVPDADTEGGAVRTSAMANAQAIRVVVDTPLAYLGQAHSHPGEHVSHSAVDDADTFARCDGVISVVVPWFGRYGLRLDQCGVHRHIGGRFVRIRDVQRHLRLIPGLSDLRPKGAER
jgi:hypothetical protein